MKLRIAVLVLSLLMLGLSVVPFAAAQTSVSMSFDGTYSGISCIGPEGCVGAGLYGGAIDGVAVGAGKSVPGMICDDYFDHIYAGQPWTANGISVSNLNASNIASLTLFGGPTGIGVTGYTEAAYLANLMLTSAGLSSAQKVGLSEAIWFITSKGASGALAAGSWGATYYGMALSALNAGASFSQFANLYLYMPTGPSPHPQEMFSLVAVPEGGTTLGYLLLSGLCCIGAIRFRARRKITI